MPREQLNRQLLQLHEDLSKIENLDPSARESLRLLLGDIQKILGDKTQTPSPKENLFEALDDHIRILEADHPSLTAAIQRLIDGLNSLGI